MKARFKTQALLLALAVASSVITATSAEASGRDSVGAVSTITPGASFVEVADLGITGSRTYVYLPSVMYNPTPMLTPVVFVYSDDGYSSEEVAWKALSKLGLIVLAESQHAALIVQNPVGVSWDAADVNVYKGILDYTFGGNSASSGKLALSYYRLNYMLGEARGATFINQYMTQAPNVNRIAGIATFGGNMPTVAPGSALPAYIAGGSKRAVDYYKAANDVDTRHHGDTYYNSTNPAKKVVVSDRRVSRFDGHLISDAYYSLFLHTARQALSTPVFYDPATTEDFTLMQRPNLKTLNVQQLLVSGSDTGSTGQTRWYEWIPDEVLESRRSHSSKKYPLVIDLHGRGDHEIYEAESNGWIDVAGKEKVIVVAPFTETASAVMNLLSVIESKYPVDRSRVYLTGYSMGGSNTWVISSQYPDVFAAIAPMSSPGANPASSISTWNDKIDLPTYYSAATNERDAVLRPNGTTIPVPQLKPANLNALNTYMNLNNITPPSGYDFVAHAIYGFAANDYKDYVTNWGFTVRVGTLSNPAGVPLMEFATGENLDHTHYMDYAPIAWDFMSKYSRDTSTGETIFSSKSELPRLADLKVGGAALSPEFDPDSLTYTVSVARNVSSVTLSATASPRNATITINGEPAARGTAGKNVRLNAPGASTHIAVIVTAPNGIRLKYDVTVHRQY